MKRSPATACGRLLLSALACLLAAAANGGAARAQESWPSAGAGDPLSGKTRKLDDYGKIGHCDETARLDNFAMELQNEQGTKAYLLVYMGRNDMPAWKEGLLKRAAGYLVETRGLDPERVKTVFGGYREQRTTELWVVAAEDPAPEPSDTVEVKHDRTKAYQWDDKIIEVEFNYKVEDEGEAADEDPGEGEGDAEGEAEAAAEEHPEAESAEEAELRRETEKYEIAIERRGVIEEEDGAFDRPEAVASEAAAVRPADGEKTAGQAEPAAAEEAEEPVVGDVRVKLWWNVERFAAALGAEPDSRACLVYYYGVKNADRETVLAIVARAVGKMGEQLGLKRDDIILVDGGKTPNPSIELWVVPRGAEPPKPKPNKRWNVSFYSAPGE
ncbi:MAG: hypothetical protein LC795_22485 [Acidobacteria bacterium]|nr:hypothetical protein [Acidobacteriota bacterium]